jgi:phosphatidylserine/phosphatidylglycerophosphate/cardiolipin synthase-like enzyme
MHHKVIVMDGELTVAGSFNFSDGADKDNDENVVIMLNRTIAQKFEDEFQRVYGEARSAAGSLTAQR